MTDNTQMMKMFMLMAEMSAETEEDKVNAQADIVFRTPGIIKPDNWDTLPLEEKKSRLEKVKSVQ